MSKNNKVVPVWLQKKLQALAAVYQDFPEDFTPEQKKEILDIAAHTSKTYVAKKLKCHPTTLNKWQKTLNQDQLHNFKKHDKYRDSGIHNHTRNLNLVVMLTLLIVPLEFYLGFKGYQLCRSVFKVGNFEAVLMATLVELIPISMCYVKVNTIMGICEKSIALFCILSSFAFSVYCVAGVEVNDLLQQISDTNKTQQVKSTLRTRIESIEKDIAYYKTAIRQDGKGYGWPYRVRELQKDRTKVQGELDAQNNIKENNKTLLWINLLMVLTLRVSWQLASLIISSRIFILWKKK